MNKAISDHTAINSEEPFTLIASYTRAEALADGEQIEVTATAAETGIRYPVFLTRAAYGKYVVVPNGVKCQD